MPNIKELREQREAAMERLKSAETMDDLQGAKADIDAIDAQIDVLDQKAALIEGLGAKGGAVAVGTGAPAKAATVGEHFVKYREAHPDMDNRVVSTPFKAAGDPTTTTGLVATEYDRVPVRRVAAPLTVLDLFARKSVGNPVYSWTVYGSATGAVGTTAEGATKNKLTYAYAQKSATLQKITGLIKVTEELFADAAYVADAINQDLVDDLNAARQSEAVKTLLATSGLQTKEVAYSGAADIFRGILDAAAAVEDQTNIAPDAVVVTPATWLILRSAMDKNERFYAGEPFGDSDYSRLFEMTFIKSADVTEGHAIVGAFARGAELVSKAEGVRVDSTNSNDTDFEKNLVSIRAEAREILAVKRPACFCDVTLTAKA